MSDLEKAKDLLKPKPIYYGENSHIEAGQIIVIEASENFPEFIVCHPDDVNKLPELPGLVWTPIKDWKPDLRKFKPYGFDTHNWA